MIWFHSLFFFFFKTEEGEISGSDEESGDEDRVSGHILDKLGVYIIKYAKQWMISSQLSLNLDLKNLSWCLFCEKIFRINLGFRGTAHLPLP